MTIESDRGEFLFAKSDLPDGLSPGGEGSHRLMLSALILLELNVSFQVKCAEGIANYKDSADATGAWTASEVSVGGRGKERTHLDNVLQIQEGLSSSSVGSRQQVQLTTIQRVGNGPEYDDVGLNHAFDIRW